jgi:hypothetical protein
MTESTTRDSLGIFFKGEERPGVAVYGYFAARPAAPVAAPLHAWTPHARCASFELGHGTWWVAMWEIAVETWPADDAWRPTLAATLGALVDAGARVAWCAVDEALAEPPLLLAPAAMSDRVYAAMTADRALLGGSALDAPFALLGDDELERLNAVALGPRE